MERGGAEGHKTELLGANGTAFSASYGDVTFLAVFAMSSCQGMHHCDQRPQTAYLIACDIKMYHPRPNGGRYGIRTVLTFHRWQISRGRDSNTGCQPESAAGHTGRMFEDGRTLGTSMSETNETEDSFLYTWGLNWHLPHFEEQDKYEINFSVKKTTKDFELFINPFLVVVSFLNI